MFVFAAAIVGTDLHLANCANMAFWAAWALPRLFCLTMRKSSEMFWYKSLLLGLAKIIGLTVVAADELPDEVDAEVIAVDDLVASNLSRRMENFLRGR